MKSILTQKKKCTRNGWRERDKGGKNSLHDSKNRGSLSFTKGNRRMFPRYTTCATIPKIVGRMGNPSTSQRKRCTTMMV